MGHFQSRMKYDIFELSGWMKANIVSKAWDTIDCSIKIRSFAHFIVCTRVKSYLKFMYKNWLILGQTFLESSRLTFPALGHTQ